MALPVGGCGDGGDVDVRCGGGTGVDGRDGGDGWGFGDNVFGWVGEGESAGVVSGSALVWRVYWDLPEAQKEGCGKHDGQICCLLDIRSLLERIEWGCTSLYVLARLMTCVWMGQSIIYR